jgi:hypothetical protein
MLMQKHGTTTHAADLMKFIVPATCVRENLSYSSPGNAASI